MVEDTRKNKNDVPLATRAEVDELRKDMARILQLLEPPANGGALPNGQANPSVGAGAQQWPTGNGAPANQAPQGAGGGLGGLGQLAQAKQLLESLDNPAGGGAFDANQMMAMVFASHMKLMDGITSMVIGTKVQQALTTPGPTIVH